ncbi:hypothetical protein CHUAL_003273 [Chamberlinius hualienensis]
MKSHKFAKSGYSVTAIIVHLLFISLLLVSDAKAQYEYDNNDGSSAQSSRKGHLDSSSWDNVNQAILEKCIQMQSIGFKKRNFGLDISDLIINRIQGGTESSANLKDLRHRMLANGK